jgi:AICAR transformylase/IMP cyclohydrolase PurH (only IMP cyclohydrolase domain in Aful)
MYKNPVSHIPSLTDCLQLNGKELSYNNLNDANGAIELLKEFDLPTAVAVKHANPCGVASADDILTAYLKAYNSDPVSIFGGIVALNRKVESDIAIELTKIFLEIIIAPDFSDDALEILRKRKIFEF